LDNAAAQKRRYDDLAERGSVTPRAVEDVTTRLQVAEATLAQARAAARAAEVQLGYATLTSPLDGWVVERRVEAGDMVAPGAVLFTLEDLSRVKVVAEIPEGVVARGLAASGSPAEVRILERSYPAEITRLLPAGDPASRTFEAHLFLDNGEGAFRSGMFARVRLEGAAEATDAGLWVPASALVRRGQLQGIFVVDLSSTQARARLRWLRVGEETGREVEILAGLEAGERYLPAPPPELEEGRALTIQAGSPGREDRNDE
jgi:RND family efflux transporter MFP subunit